MGDNIFYGQNLPGLIKEANAYPDDAFIFAAKVVSAEQYGVIELNSSGAIVSMEEKPVKPRSRLAVMGIYVFPGDAPAVAKTLRPSGRGELEILDLAKHYWRNGVLQVRQFGRGTAWFDSGTQQSLLDAANFVATVQSRQGVQIACLEEIAWQKGWIDREQLLKAAHAAEQSGYGEYIRQIAENG